MPTAVAGPLLYMPGAGDEDCAAAGSSLCVAISAALPNFTEAVLTLSEAVLNLTEIEAC